MFDGGGRALRQTALIRFRSPYLSFFLLNAKQPRKTTLRYLCLDILDMSKSHSV